MNLLNPKVKTGTAGDRLYKRWAGMKQRCNNSKIIEFNHYGGRGITYDKKWETFSGFKEDMGKTYKFNYSLDRIDVNGNYCKENCRWILKSEQSKNRRCIRWLTCRGLTLSMADWARKLNMNRTTIFMRINSYKWPVERALFGGQIEP